MAGLKAEIFCMQFFSVALSLSAFSLLPLEVFHKKSSRSSTWLSEWVKSVGSHVDYFKCVFGSSAPLQNVRFSCEIWLLCSLFLSVIFSRHSGYMKGELIWKPAYMLFASIAFCTSIHTLIHIRSAEVPLPHRHSSSSITLIRNQRRKVFLFVRSFSSLC